MEAPLACKLEVLQLDIRPIDSMPKGPWVIHNTAFRTVKDVVWPILGPSLKHTNVAGRLEIREILNQRAYEESLGNYLKETIQNSYLYREEFVVSLKIISKMSLSPTGC